MICFFPQNTLRCFDPRVLQVTAGINSHNHWSHCSHSQSTASVVNTTIRTLNRVSEMPKGNSMGLNLGPDINEYMSWHTIFQALQPPVGTRPVLSAHPGETEAGVQKSNEVLQTSRGQRKILRPGGLSLCHVARTNYQEL